MMARTKQRKQNCILQSAEFKGTGETTADNDERFLSFNFPLVNELVCVNCTGFVFMANSFNRSKMKFRM